MWKQFSEAIDNADDWLTTDEPVPARPLQEPSQWPAGATMVLMGVAMITGQLSAFSFWLLENFPVLARIG